LISKNAIVVKLSFIFIDRFSNNYHTYLIANFIGKLEHQNTLVTQFLNTLTPQHGHTTKAISFQIQLSYMVTMQLAKNSKKLTEKGEFTLEKKRIPPKFSQIKKWKKFVGKKSLIYMPLCFL
jgi:hypothetical protein